MTYDELLEILEHTAQDGMADEPILNALRAVVELHKPRNGLCGICIGGNCDCCTGFEPENYPCPTIQQIIENL